MSELLNTKIYSIFKLLPGNRPVDEKHVKKLIRAIESNDLLQENPLQVTSAMEVIDGQHRLAAAKKLGKHVWYRIEEKLQVSDMIAMNSNSKNWSVNDYINYHLVAGAPGYQILSDFMVSNPLIPVSTILALVTEETHAGGSKIENLRRGVIDVSNMPFATAVANALGDFFNIIPFAYERAFVLATSALLRAPGYDHVEMIRQWELQSRSLKRCITVRHYADGLEEIYNYKKSKNNLKIKC